MIAAATFSTSVEISATEKNFYSVEKFAFGCAHPASPSNAIVPRAAPEMNPLRLMPR